MSAYHVKRALEILRDEGVLQLSNSTYSFIRNRSKKKFHRIRTQWRYRKPSHPRFQETYLVPVDEIKYILWQNDLRENFGGSKPGKWEVLDGDWDLAKEEFERTPIYLGFNQRFTENREWEETSYYSWLREELEYTQEECLNRLNKYDELYHDIKTNGYDKSQPIIVHIGRNGEYIRHNGVHRLSIAKILEIDSIPVKVRNVHTNWQALRKDVCKNGLSEGQERLRDHPDLQDILD